MESSAKMTCVLKVNFHCDGCKSKVMQVLQNLRGIYSVVIEAEEGTVKVSGKVDPTLMLSVLDRFKQHGEISSLRFDGEEDREARHHYPYYGGNHYIPYEPYPQYPLLHGSNQYPLLPQQPGPPLPPPPPPTHWPPPPPPPQFQPPALPSPLLATCPSSSTPPDEPAPQSSTYPQCCSTM